MVVQPRLMPDDDLGSFLHWSFQNEHVLFQGLEVTSIWTWCLASVLTAALCLFERFITFLLDKKNTSSPNSHQARWSRALCRALLYWVATVIRLLYMLIAMSFNIGLIIVIASSLAAGQFVIELLKDPPPKSSDSFVTESLLHSAQGQQVPLQNVHRHTRSRSKPTEAFIHPQQSDPARADHDMGIFNDPELGRPGTGDTWEHGKGKELARFLMGGRESPSQEEHLFRIDDDNPDGSESDSS